jgi:hypothetical protein
MDTLHGSMRLKFDLREHRGCVEVTVVPNDDPESLGCTPFGRGFPVCTATVSFAGRGYAAAFGWIQLVRSTDGASGGLEFEMDPFEPLGALPHPFCWFGVAPTLFDAPSRQTRADLEWMAHSFLSFIAQPREARAILGFSWGFTVAEGQVSTTPPMPLEPGEWDRHLPILQREHPAWLFAPGYYQH